MKALKLLMSSLIFSLVSVSTVQAATEMTIYKSPQCDCCERYAAYLRENGFAVKTVEESDMNAIRKRYGMSHLASCHTALVNGYVIEGHVPVSAIRKLLIEKPAIRGISLPGMRTHSPGMGEMKKGTLTIFGIPKEGNEQYIFSVE